MKPERVQLPEKPFFSKTVQIALFQSFCLSSILFLYERVFRSALVVTPG